VAEGGTGDPVPGEFAPGNGDGRVLRIGPMATDREVVVDGLTNSQDPGGGVVGANHALVHRVLSPAGTSELTLVAQAGGPGHLRPEEAAKILAVDSMGEVTVLADTLAFEQEHNPDGEAAPEGVDSNPWRMAALDPETVLIADAGANDVLALDVATGALSLFAVFERVGDSQAIPTGIAVDEDVVYVALLGSIFALTPSTEVRRLHDANDDGDALDAGENETFVGGMHTPTDLRIGPFGHLYVLQMFPGTLARIDPACWSPGSACDEAAAEVVATGLTAATALTWDDNFDALVTSGPANEAGPSLQTDRVVRVPAARVHPTETPTATPTTLTPTPEAGSTIYLPSAARRS
jgi:hypothetical protein